MASKVLERTTSWNSTKDDDFGLQFDGDLLRVDLEHSLMEVTAMLQQQGGDCPLPFSEETPVPSHHHHQQQQGPPALQRPLSQPRMGHLQDRDNAATSSAGKQAYPFTPVPRPDQQQQQQQPPPLLQQQEENGGGHNNPLEQSAGSVTSSVTSGSSSGGSSGKKAVAPRINVRLMPQNSATAARVRQAGYNPKLELSTPLGKRVGFFVGHLASKWSNVRGIGALSLRLAALPTQQLDDDVPLRSLSAHFAAAKKSMTPTAPGVVVPSSVLQLHYVLVAASSSASHAAVPATGMEVDGASGGSGSWLPEENSLFDAFAATGLEQLPVVASAVQQQQQQQQQQKVPLGATVQASQPAAAKQPGKHRKRISLTTGVASNRNDTFVNAATMTPAPTKFTPSTSSSSFSSFESSGENSQGHSRSRTHKSEPGSEVKKRRIRPTLLPVGEKVATSPCFLQAQCGVSSFTSESSRQSCFSNSGEFE